MLTKQRALEILRRVWVNGECLSAREAMELDAAGDAPTAFAQCMVAAEIPDWDRILAIENWQERNFALRRLIAHHEFAEHRAPGSKTVDATGATSATGGGQNAS